ncbi:TPA: PIN-like domain-containing protein [Clostridioides difficile]
MRKAVYEYIEPTSDEKENLMSNAVIVFDTNVLLNLYRYSVATRNGLLSTLKGFEDRIWLPHHVAKEFMEKRCNIIFDSINKYEELSKDSKTFVSNIKKKLRFIEDDKDLADLEIYIDEWIDNIKTKNLEVFNPNEDNILKQVLDLFDGKVGDEYKKEDLEKIKKEGESRYKCNIPPGYKDSKKQKDDFNDNNKYGDLIIWNQILDYSKDNKKDIIYITNDQKEDWWNKVHGKIIGPRYELRKEFYNFSNQKFHMYSMQNFIEIFNEQNKDKIGESVLQEVNYVDSLEDVFNLEDLEWSDYEETSKDTPYIKHIKEKRAPLEESLNQFEKQKNDIEYIIKSEIDKMKNINAKERNMNNLSELIKNLKMINLRIDNIKERLKEIELNIYLEPKNIY